MSFVYKSLSEKLENDEYIYAISVEDVQTFAQEMLGRKLDFYEMDRVKDGVEWGMIDWDTIVKTAISELDNSPKRDGKEN